MFKEAFKLLELLCLTYTLPWSCLKLYKSKGISMEVLNDLLIPKVYLFKHNIDYFYLMYTKKEVTIFTPL